MHWALLNCNTKETNHDKNVKAVDTPMGLVVQYHFQRSEYQLLYQYEKVMNGDVIV